MELSDEIRQCYLSPKTDERIPPELQPGKPVLHRVELCADDLRVGGGVWSSHHRRRRRRRAEQFSSEAVAVWFSWRRRRQQSVSLYNTAGLAVISSKISYAKKLKINVCVYILSRVLCLPLRRVFDTLCLSVVVVYNACVVAKQQTCWKTYCTIN